MWTRTTPGQGNVSETVKVVELNVMQNTCYPACNESRYWEDEYVTGRGCFRRITENES